MCGIAGIRLAQEGPVGHYLVDMMTALRHRGTDSTGFGLYGAPREDRLIARLRVEPRDQLDQLLQEVVDALRDSGGDLRADPTWDSKDDAPDAFIRLEITPEVDIDRLTGTWLDLGEVEVHSMGHALEIIKDVGDAQTVAARHGIAAFQGSHGLGHCRLATESDVDVCHSHPFWARPFSDIAIVHNGQITNYYKYRRLLEQDGYQFCSENDSELIAVYIADRMKHGELFEKALRHSVTALDGVFTYLISTRDGIGLAKDRLAIKPMIAVEAPHMVAMATEEQALRQVLREEIDTVSYGPREVLVWNQAT